MVTALPVFVLSPEHLFASCRDFSFLMNLPCSTLVRRTKGSSGYRGSSPRLPCLRFLQTSFLSWFEIFSFPVNLPLVPCLPREQCSNHRGPSCLSFLMLLLTSFLPWVETFPFLCICRCSLLVCRAAKSATAIVRQESAVLRDDEQ